ncbi:hypothetical protein M1555_03175 [Patescibacteria group bacterium]|nr:hypothetical protein [Patescibacteria group bacterium]
MSSIEDKIPELIHAAAEARRIGFFASLAERLLPRTFTVVGSGEVTDILAVPAADVACITVGEASNPLQVRFIVPIGDAARYETGQRYAIVRQDTRAVLAQGIVLETHLSVGPAAFLEKGAAFDESELVYAFPTYELPEDTTEG